MSQRNQEGIFQSHIFFSVKFPHVYPQCFYAELGWRDSNIKQGLDTKKSVTLESIHLKYLTQSTETT